MAVTQEQIDAQQVRVDGLNQMIADGVRQATVGDQTITYNTTDSLIRARNDAQDLLNTLKSQMAGKPAPARSLLYYAGRGY